MEEKLKAAAELARDYFWAQTSKAEAPIEEKAKRFSAVEMAMFCLEFAGQFSEAERICARLTVFVNRIAE